jgi:predicted Fe-Mo cluster-binding NifX family protein
VIACVPIDSDGSVGHGWGRADRVAVARVKEGRIEDWREVQVDWGAQHDSGSSARHHARVARFLKENDVDTVVAGHMGDGMVQMLATMKLTVRLEAAGDARAAVLAAASPPEE